MKAKEINILAVDKDGKPQLNLTPTPDVNMMDVWRPYK
jgi:hypothetical protein